MTIMFWTAFSYDCLVIVLVFPSLSEDNKRQVSAEVNRETVIAIAIAWGLQFRLLILA